MAKPTQKIKRSSKSTNEFREPEVKEYPHLDLFSEAEKPQKISPFLHREKRRIDASIGASSKLKKVDLVKVSQDKMKKQHLPNPAGWNITDGDYRHEIAENDDKILQFKNDKKKLQKIYFAIALALVALIVLGIASIAAKAFSL